MLDFLNSLNPMGVNFILVVLFSLSLGMERRKQYESKAAQQTFGTDRTFTFIGVLGFLLLMADTTTKIPYLFGMGILTLFMAIFYTSKVFKEQHYGLTSIILSFVTYGFPLFLHTMTLWLSLLLFVVVLLLSGIKKPLKKASRKIDDDEFLTLVKFLVIAGIILSPYKIWLAVVVVSAISYLSYLLQKYVFPNSGLLLTALLGGLYSSTASTIILSRKSKNDDEHPKAYAGAIMIGIAMMYVRVFILLLIFNSELVLESLPYFVILFVVTVLVGILFYNSDKRVPKAKDEEVFEDDNPLEFKVALLFAGLYVFFSVITNFALTYYGEGGLSVLSLIVGVTDITSFLLNLFQGNYVVGATVIIVATFQAMASNNILKAAYSQFLTGENTRKQVLKAFGIVILANVLVIAALYLI